MIVLDYNKDAFLVLKMGWPSANCIAAFNRGSSTQFRVYNGSSNYSTDTGLERRRRDPHARRRPR
jgi:hypothetical protein